MGLFTPFRVVLLAALGQFFMAQRGVPFLVLPALLCFAIAVLLFHRTSRQIKETQFIFTPRVEAAGLMVILAIAVFFRVWHIDVFPCGVSVDQSLPGLGGLMVWDGWRPLFETPILQIPSLIFYPAALWFHFLGATQVSQGLFCALLSLLAFPFVYWVFRQLAGVGPALLMAAFWAVARWDVSLGRWAAVNVMPILFIYGALAFWLQGLSKGKTSSYLIAGLFLGLGFYGYYAFWIFPFVLAVLAFWEARQQPELFRRDRLRWLGSALVFVLLAAPLFWHWSQKSHWGQDYPAQQFIGKTVLEQKSLMPLVHNCLDFLGMFNRQGDPSPKQTTDQAPMLDLFTGALAVVGFGLAFFRSKERKRVYPLLIFAGLSLNNILCTDPTNVCHALSLLPCVLFWAGDALWRFLQTTRKSIGILVAAVILLFAAALNYHQLFDVQAKDPKAAGVFDLGPTLAGEEVARLGARYDMVLCSSFGQHLTVRFLGYFHQKDYRDWDWPKDLAFAETPSRKEGVCFVLARGELGIFQLLKELYPQAETSILKDPQGVPLVYEVKVASASLAASREMKWTRKKPSQWMGSACLFIPESGVYRFGLKRGRRTVWEIDGAKIEEKNGVFLIRGFHSLMVRSSVKDSSLLQLFWTDALDHVRALDSSDLTQLPLDHGLLVQYGKEETPVFEQWDPVVNYVSKADFNFYGSPWVRWTGQIFAPAAGDYSFLALTQPTDTAKLSLDEKMLASWMPSPSGKVHLDEGWHSLKVELQMGDGVFSAMNLAWQKPGDEHYQPIPMSSFGAVQTGIR